MKTVGFFVLMLVIIILGRVVGGSVARNSAHSATSPAVSADTQTFLIELDDFQRSNKERAYITNKSHLEAVKESGWEHLFDVSRIKHDKDLQKSFQIITKAKVALSTYRMQINANISSSKAQIQQLNISLADRDAMLSSYDKVIPTSERILDLEDKKIQEAESIFQIMRSSRTWKVGDTGIVFADANERAAVGAHLGAIQSIEAQESDARAQAQGLLSD
jgi:hypothetical protein